MSLSRTTFAALRIAASPCAVAAAAGGGRRTLTTSVVSHDDGPTLPSDPSR